MKTVAFNGSARTGGNTAVMLDTVMEELEDQDIETEVVNLADLEIGGCTACYRCHETQDGRCVVDDDDLNDCLEKMRAAEGILIGSPTYFADVSPETKALIDRCGFVAKANDSMLARKVGAAAVAVRRAGSTHAFDTINHFFTISEMVIPGSVYWNMGFGLEKGDVSSDAEGLETMRTLGQNMAWVMQNLHG